MQSPIYSQVAVVLDACDAARDDHNAKLQEAVLSFFSGLQSDLQVKLQAFGEQAPVKFEEECMRLCTSGSPIDSTMQEGKFTVFASDAAKDLYSAFRWA